MKTKLLLKAAFFAAMLSALLVAYAAATCVGVATVEGDGLRLRSAASVEAEVLDTADKGDVAVVLEEAKDGWYKVDFGTQVGYMSAGFVSVETVKDVDLGYGRVTTSGGKLNLRADATTAAAVVTKLPYGTAVNVIGVKDGWFKVTYAGQTGYASSDYITLAQDEKGTRADAGTATQSTSALGAQIVAEAMKHLGKEYRAGGKGPNSFDCSGFVYYVCKQFGITLSGGSTNQWRTAPGTRIYSVSELQPGDLFFVCDPARANGYATSHVGIYIGNGRMIHASTYGVGVTISSITGNYTKYFVGGIRVG